ncbi:uncharacterized protein [Elaeis guineensis]|uniref:uncharacterized protein n=1 Tax=Elaeis guineensis var. tenera TaxID=51953 RepID=UPI003C6D2F99
MLTYKQRRTSGKLLRRRTKAGMTSAAESITEGLRCTCQLMVQEVERSANTLATFEESTSVLKKAKGLLKLQRKLLAAIKEGSKGHEEVAVEIQRAAVGDGLNHAPTHGNAVPQAEIPVPHVYDEL